MKKQTEKQLEKKIILNLKLHGFYVYKTASSGSCYDFNMQYNEAGIADLVVIGGPNKVTFLEVKTPNGKQSIIQKVFEELCKKHGVKYAVIRSVGEALKALTEPVVGYVINNQTQEVQHGIKSKKSGDGQTV